MDHGHAKLSYHEKKNQVASCWIPYHPPKESSPKISILPYIIMSYVQIQLFVSLMHRPGGPTCSFNLFPHRLFPASENKPYLITHSSPSNNLLPFPRDVHLPTIPQIIRLLPYPLCIHTPLLGRSLAAPEVEWFDKLYELGPELIECGICCCFCRIRWVGGICRLWSVREGRNGGSGSGRRGRGRRSSRYRSRNHNVRTLI